jgi:hypothetical protein
MRIKDPGKIGLKAGRVLNKRKMAKHGKPAEQAQNPGKSSGTTPAWPTSQGRMAAMFAA